MTTEHTEILDPDELQALERVRYCETSPSFKPSWWLEPVFERLRRLGLVWGKAGVGYRLTAEGRAVIVPDAPPAPLLA